MMVRFQSHFTWLNFSTKIMSFNLAFEKYTIEVDIIKLKKGKKKSHILRFHITRETHDFGFVFFLHFHQIFNFKNIVQSLTNTLNPFVPIFIF